MKRKTFIIMVAVLMVVLTACNNNTEDETDELKMLEVDFEVPESADVGEVVELKATVTYGDELVLDADEVTFEYWLEGNEEDSTTIDANNNEDGTYTAEVAFDSDGIYEMYAHTTARDLHTMPKKSIVIGEGESADHEHDHHDNGHEHAHTEGFHLHFMEPKEVVVNDETELSVHVMLDEDPLEDARVRYEITHDELEIHDWVDTNETVPGEYSNTYSFTEAGSYTIIFHVENEDGLHEHIEQKIEVNEM